MCVPHHSVVVPLSPRRPFPLILHSHGTSWMQKDPLLTQVKKVLSKIQTYTDAKRLERHKKGMPSGSGLVLDTRMRRPDGNHTERTAHPGARRQAPSLERFLFCPGCLPNLESLNTKGKVSGSVYWKTKIRFKHTVNVSVSWSYHFKAVWCEHPKFTAWLAPQRGGDQPGPSPGLVTS